MFGLMAVGALCRASFEARTWLDVTHAQFICIACVLSLMLLRRRWMELFDLMISGLRLVRFGGARKEEAPRSIVELFVKDCS